MEKITLKRVLKQQDLLCGLNSSHSEQGPVAGSCGHPDEPSGSMKGGKGLDHLSVWLTSAALSYFLFISF
jgi:hypothetical protein